MKPFNIQGYKLLQEGCIALSQVEANGIKINTKYLEKTIQQVSNRIKRKEDKIKKSFIYKKWKKVYGSNTNINSKDQLGNVLFNHLEYPCKRKTATGKPKTDEEAIEALKIPFSKRYIDICKLKKLKSTYLKGLQKHVVNGYLHPVFNLHLVQTFRSSSDSPNFQNIPIRNPEYAKIIRSCFIARKNHCLIEVDYSGAEIACAAAYHKDPRMISYITDKEKDMHRDMAAQCYLLKTNQVTKNTRYCGKNKFIFPQFYGDYWLNCAKSLWESINSMKLETVDGLSLKDHLRKEGIKKLGNIDDNNPKAGTFLHHIKKVEDDFWNDRFKVYGQWKKDWYNAYLEKGYFDTLTGFRLEGLYRRNEVINYPVQGSAFHWLLWSLIKINKLLKKYRMRSVIVGQIHDSIVADVYKDEVRDYLEICQDIMTQKIRKHWRWINVPLEIEAEVTPLNGNWYEKKERKLK